MALANIMGTDGIIVLVIVLVVIFGGSQLPKIARNVGSAGKEFRKAQEDAEAEHQAKEAAKAREEIAPAPSSSDDRVTLSKAELNALLDEREARAKERGTGN
jgi:sec-independent protein translocase protein TatA